MARDRKVMFLCAHNQTRSVAGEGLLTGERGFEVRSRALWKGTKRKVTEADGEWADEVYVMMPGMVPVAVEAGIPRKKVHALWIPDKYYTCEPDLILELKRQLAAFGIHPKKSMDKAQEDCYQITERKLGYRGDQFIWTWEPSKEEVAELGKESCGTGSRPSISDERYEYPYVPMWHIREGERKAAERTHEQMLAEFEEAEAYCKQKQKEREDAKLEEEFMLSEMTGVQQREYLRDKELEEAKERYKRNREREIEDTQRRMRAKEETEKGMKGLESYTKMVRKLFE